MKRPLLLDLFSGAGGCAVGYHRAGFDVVGVDNRPQPHYPFPFVQADALTFLVEHGREYDAIHASPPCQGYSRMRHLPWLKGKVYPLLIDATLALLEQTGKPWVVENVEDAYRHLRGSIMLCGTMFGLKVYRHRLFLSNVWQWQPPHAKHKVTIGKGPLLNDRTNGNAEGFVSLPSKGTRRNGLRGLPNGMISACGKGGGDGGEDVARAAMGIDWMTRAELAQAIPPAYTEYVGRQLLAALDTAPAPG